MSEVEINPDSQSNTMEPGKGRKKIGLIILLLVVVVAGIAAWQWRQDLLTSISTDNAKVTGDIVDISPKITGRLEKILVSEQEQVKKGQIIARLDNEQLKIALEQAGGVLDQAKANYDKLPDDLKSAVAAVNKAQEGVAAAQGKVKTNEISLADAQRVLAENEKLFQAGALSKEALDASNSRCQNAESLLETEQANLRVAQATLDDALAKNESANKSAAPLYLAQLKQAQAALDTARYNNDNSVIRAPISGTVLRVSAQAGENVTACETLLSLCDLNSTWVAANIEEKKIARINRGELVDIRIDGYPGEVIPGRVEAVGNVAQSVFALIPSENTSGNFTKVTQRLTIKILPLRRNLVLKPGMSAQVKIHTTP